MEIIIPLPQYNFSTNTYKELKSYLKQLELAVHHAQKSVENAEKDGIEISEGSFINFEHPVLESSIQIDENNAKSDELKQWLINFFDDYYDALQNVELRINLE